MAISDKQRRALKLAEKRRERRPVTEFKEPLQLAVKHAERERITNGFPLVLLAIETTLAESFLANPSIDDAVVQSALRHSIRQQPTEEESVALLVKALERAKEETIGYHKSADEIWSTGLRIIYQSVGTHSDGNPHGRGYLKFAVEFVRRATGPRLKG